MQAGPMRLGRLFLQLLPLVSNKHPISLRADAGREREGMWADAGRDRDHAGLPGNADADADRATCSMPLPRFPSSVPRSCSGAAADHSGAGRGLSGVPGLNTLSKSGTTGERAGGANNIRSSVLVGPTISVLLIMELLVLRCWCS